MTSEDSPLKKYYPEDFSKDLNGKKQDWEAVVLIPFIDQVYSRLVYCFLGCKTLFSETFVKCNGTFK